MTWNSYRRSSWQGEPTPLELKGASRLRGSIYGVAGPQDCQGPEALSLHLPLACSQWSLGTRQSWQLVSTHTTAGQLTPGPPQSSQFRVLLGHLFPQVVIKTQTEYQLSSPDQPKKFPDLEAQKLACNHPEEGRRVTQPSQSHAAQ